jgi:hypothetical protein
MQTYESWADIYSAVVHIKQDTGTIDCQWIKIKMANMIIQVAHV